MPASASLTGAPCPPVGDNAERLRAYEIAAYATWMLLFDPLLIITGTYPHLRFRFTYPKARRLTPRRAATSH